MPAPAIEALKQQIDDLSSEYAARFAGHSRVTRELGDIDSLVKRTKEVVAKLDALPKSAKDAEVEALTDLAKTNLQLYQTERTAIAEAKQGGPAMVEFAALGTQANFVFARYRRHFAGKSRNTRDLGLLAEMVDDLQKLQARMKTLIAGKSDQRMQDDYELVGTNIKLYVAERGEIVESRNAGTPEEQADVLAEVANLQFQVYQDHFASKSRLTRRPELLQRMIDNLKLVKERMEALQKGGVSSESNGKNIGIVQSNIEMYVSELAEIRKARSGVKLADLMGNLGTAANDIMNEYRENFAGKDRATRDLDLLSRMTDQLGEVFRQMTALQRAEKNEMNAKNMAIVNDNLVMLESEYEEIRKAKSPS
ncbi:MAG: hypothetical protein ABI175_16690 [Polyangiales bacterium]